MFADFFFKRDPNVAKTFVKSQISVPTPKGGLISESFSLWITDNGHPERDFFQKFKTFGLGQTNWAEILSGIRGISGQTISTILAL